MMNCLLLAVTYLLMQPVLITMQPHEIDCIDSRRRLRCVHRKDCPLKRLIIRHCPPGLVCCLKYKSNISYPLRIIENETLITASDFVYSNNYMNQNIVFPTDLDNIKHQKVVQPSYEKLIASEIDIICQQKKSKSEDYCNLLFPKVVQNTERKSVEACKRYAKITVEHIFFMHLLPQVKPRKMPIEKCEPKRNPLIVGGVKANIKDYPHMAALGYNKSELIDYLCGGSLISENFILTAAHCVNTRWGPPVVVHLGSAELYSKEATTVSIKQVIIHPEYKPTSSYYDIALVRLENSVNFSMILRPACLPTYQSEVKAKTHVLVATGWGKTGFGRESSVMLSEVALKTIKNEDCIKHYEKETKALTHGITSNMLCALGHKNVEHDTCQGDSGGPLQAPLAPYKCMSQVIAITSFGKACGAGIPAVYTRVLSYLSWIEDIVW